MGQLDDAVAQQAADAQAKRERDATDRAWLERVCQEFVSKASELRISPRDLYVTEWHRRRFWGGTKTTRKLWARGWVVDRGDYDGGESQIVTTEGGYFRGGHVSVADGAYSGSQPRPGSVLEAHRLEENMASFLLRYRS
jgi:hypothetical protein